MKQKVIQDFLNLPGIAGVALMDGRSRPYFCGVDQTLNFQQKEALAQGILQVVDTIPEEFESFEFQFTGHQVHIYKLDQGIILLVLTRDSLIYSDYLQTIKNLKAALRDDITNAIATFRLIAGNITLSGQPYHQRSPDSLSSQTTTANHQTASHLSTSTSTPPAQLATSPPPATPSTPASTNDISLKDLIAALNHLSKFTTQYLGTHVIVNYWKSTRPNHAWLENFQIDRSAQLSFTGSTPQGLQSLITPQEKAWIQEWVAIFIKRCSQVIRDFPILVEQKALDEIQRDLLLG